MLKVRVIRACTGRFRYRVPPASRGRQEPPQALEFLPWDALGPPVYGVPGGQALQYGTRAPAHSKALNPLARPCLCEDISVGDKGEQEKTGSQETKAR